LLGERNVPRGVEKSVLQKTGWTESRRSLEEMVKNCNKKRGLKKKKKKEALGGEPEAKKKVFPTIKEVRPSQGLRLQDF